MIRVGTRSFSRGGTVCEETDFAVFRPSEGNWYVLKSSNGAVTAMHWGMLGDMPVAGDYDHDGKTDFAVFRASDRGWYVHFSSSGSYASVQFGLSDDVPIPAAYID